MAQGLPRIFDPSDRRAPDGLKRPKKSNNHAGSDALTDRNGAHGRAHPLTRFKDGLDPESVLSGLEVGRIIERHLSTAVRPDPCVLFGRGLS
jgi:hypothetical protein